jgi:hypothetical protein
MERKMGEYIINGEIIDVPGDRPTAGDLKRAAQAPSDDWVMATRRNGEVVQIADHLPLPHDVENYSTMPRFTYGTDS